MTDTLTIDGLKENEPLAPYTTFKIGGPARYFVVVKTEEELLHAIKSAKEHNINWIILGGGSDVLVSDAGFDGLVIKCELRDVEMNEETGEVTAGAGVLLSMLIPKTLKAGLMGLEYAIGVPAAVGGAVWANLGARGSDISKILKSVRVMDETETIRDLTPEECEFGYRDSIFKHKRYVILSATFQLTPADKKAAFAKMKELADLRKETQDVGSRCAGCVFKNPVDQTTEAAAKMIDDLDLKGTQIGGAKVSEKHANFVINTGGATADDVVQLVSFIKQQVRDKKGVQLFEEIDYVGFGDEKKVV